MRFILDADMQARPGAQEAGEIVRSCVHCGFCNATCPTYQLSGNELEGPRGRIYLMKSFLEAGAVSETTQAHLDHCLLCRNCETTCPSGVRYGRLLDLVRPQIDSAVGLHGWRRWQRAALLAFVPYPRRWGFAARLGQRVHGLLPRGLGSMLSRARRVAVPQPRAHARRVLLLGGCAQAVLNPQIDAAATRVFDRVGIALVRCAGADCCGALPYHLGESNAAARLARANIDAWWPEIEAGAEAVIATSSGCGVHLRDYAHVLADDSAYAAKAARIAALARDPLELLDANVLRDHVQGGGRRIAVQAPCTLQHGLKLAGRLERLLSDLGWQLVPVADAHLCCGSAGAHSVLHPDTAAALRAQKLGNLERDLPSEIVTANIGCQLHLAQAARVPVRHWLEVLGAALG